MACPTFVLLAGSQRNATCYSSSSSRTCSTPDAANNWLRNTTRQPEAEKTKPTKEKVLQPAARTPRVKNYPQEALAMHCAVAHSIFLSVRVMYGADVRSGDPRNGGDKSSHGANHGVFSLRVELPPHDKKQKNQVSGLYQLSPAKLQLVRR